MFAHRTWSDFVELQRQMWLFHHNLTATHSQMSRWWTWPLLLRPTWLYSVTFKSGRLANSYALGNPLLWWMFVPAELYVAWRFLKKRDPGDGLILCGFFSAWLPWAFVKRLTFIQYLTPGVPFACLAIARALSDLWAARPRLGRALAVGYTGATIVAFAMIYPILSAYPVSAERNKGHSIFWFDRWRGEGAALAEQAEKSAAAKSAAVGSSSAQASPAAPSVQPGE
jgi:dolichyl-phosphate-mannose--protein O-mannosyl transferase